MELSYDKVRAFVLEPMSDQHGWQWCGEYGEPGYDTRAGATTPLVVLGNYWCRCDRFGIDDNGRAELHGIDRHHPRVFAQLEAQGVELEWEDEWYIDYDNDKCYRTSGDSYGWQSSIMFTESGEILTPDDDLDAWLEETVNQSHRCLASRVWSAGDLERAGFTSYNGTYENGWHPGQTDDPATITRQIRDEMGDEEECEIVFLLDESSQFYIGFSAWTRLVNADEEAGVI